MKKYVITIISTLFFLTGYSQTIQIVGKRLDSIGHDGDRFILHPLYGQYPNYKVNDSTIGSDTYSIGQTNDSLTSVRSAMQANDANVLHKNTAIENASNKYLKNSYIGLSGDLADLGMTGMYDRDELTNADLKGTVTITSYASGVPTDYSSQARNLFDGSNLYVSFTAASGTTDSLKVLIDLGYNVNNYSAGYWQPFVQFRLPVDYFKNIKVEVSTDNTNWVSSNTPASWAFDNSTQSFFPTGFWMGANDYPSDLSGTWRYARFTFKNPVNTDPYVYISEIGIRHMSSPYARQYLLKAGDNIYGRLNLMNKATTMGYIDPTTGSFNGTFTGNGSGLTNLGWANILSKPTTLAGYAIQGSGSGTYNASILNTGTNATGLKTILSFPVFNGAPGLSIESWGNSFDGYNAFIHTGQGSVSKLMLSGSDGSQGSDLTINPNGSITLRVANDATGDFITRNSSTGLTNIRTTTEVLTDIGAAPKANPTFTGTVILPSTTSIGTATSTELGYVHGVTSSIQTQLDSKTPTATTGTAAPTTTPASIGLFFIDTTNKKLYVSTGTASSTDWTILN